MAPGPLERLRVGAAALEHAGFVVGREEGLDLVVVLQLGIQQHPLDAETLVVLLEVLEHQKGGTLGLVLGQDADQQGLHRVAVPGIEGRQQVNPSEGEDTALGLADGLGDVRQGVDDGSPDG